MNSISTREDGFTLLEVLIAFALLLFITLITYSKVAQSYRLRDKFLTEGDFHNSIASAVEVISRDVSMLYSPVIMVPRKDNDPNPPDAETQKAIAEGDQTRGSKFWLGVIDVSGVRAMHFTGEERSLRFVAASHVRVYRERPESVFVKVHYSLEDDREAPEALQGTSILVKRINTSAFDPELDDKEGYRVYRLLPGIKNMSFRYFEKAKERWHSRWDSETQDFRYRIPDLIELAIEVQGTETLSFQGSYLFRPEIPIYGIHPSL
ncbi:MAG: prepilin-type N-terminal cleavage/methylation domain-containing protein [Bdellovibrionales bacterium]|nr:prepilin-type N-terminal cleavage/methylation domain-containing protein [Bdellovibrionales bacterium]